MKTLKNILQIIVDVIAFASLMVLIFGGIWFKLIRTTADVLDETQQGKSWVLIDKRARSLEDVKQGDIVLFRYFTDSNRLCLGKMLGFPGDTVWVNNGEAYVNGKKASDANGRDRGRVSQRVVPDDMVFLSEGTNGNPLTSGYRMNDAKLIYGKKVAILFPLRHISFMGPKLLR